MHPAEKKPVSIVHNICLALCLYLVCGIGLSHASGQWQSLDDGLDLGIFYNNSSTLFGSGKITILRVDPKQWDIKLLSMGQFGYESGLSAKEWSSRHKLTAAINAGMFHQDLTTHVGYLKAGKFIHNGKINQYQSLAAFAPNEKAAAPFRIFDLDEKEIDTDRIKQQYGHMVQNLRLIKRPGINRWGQQNRKWNEAALGEDKHGRALFIYSNSILSMHDLNETLLSLPIDLVSAQHLEGGPEAQLYIGHIAYKKEISNSYDTPFLGSDGNLSAWPIPNVIGISKKESPDKNESSEQAE